MRVSFSKVLREQSQTGTVVKVGNTSAVGWDELDEAEVS